MKLFLGGFKCEVLCDIVEGDVDDDVVCVLLWEVLVMELLFDV